MVFLFVASGIINLFVYLIICLFFFVNTAVGGQVLKQSIFKTMAQYDELPVYKATYDLLLSIFMFTREFKKEFKYTVDGSLKKETIEPDTLKKYNF